MDRERLGRIFCSEKLDQKFKNYHSKSVILVGFRRIYDLIKLYKTPNKIVLEELKQHRGFLEIIRRGEIKFENALKNRIKQWINYTILGENDKN